MKGFAVLSRAEEIEILKRNPLAAKLPLLNNLLWPYTDKNYNFNGVMAGNIKIPKGFEKSKLGRSKRNGARVFGNVISRDYDINYNPLFYHSCLIRALDFYTVSLGCDLRLSEVVIADAASFEGRNAFRLLLPIAKRIVLVTDKKREMYQKAEYAISKYGTSVAVINDAVKAAQHGDVVVLSSSNEDHSCLCDAGRPTLYFRFYKPPSGKLWFDDATIAFKEQEELTSVFAQGYVEAINGKGLWEIAEKDGFSIRSIKKQNMKIIER